MQVFLFDKGLHFDAFSGVYYVAGLAEHCIAFFAAGSIAKAVIAGAVIAII